MSYEVTLSWGATTLIDLHDYDGENLVLEDGFRREQVLHNKLRPVQDRCVFKVLWKTPLASALLQIDPDEIVTVEILRDSTAFFYGYLRPVTRWRVTNEPDSVIEFEALDNSWRLQRALPSPYSEQDVSVSQAVEDLLDLAGYAESEYDVPTIDITIGSILEPDAGPTFWDTLSELLYSYGFTFYFDEAGVFQVYDWSAEELPTPAGVLNDNTAQIEIEVERQIDDHDGVEVEWFEVREGSWDVVSRSIPPTDTPKTLPRAPTENNPNSRVHRYELGTDAEGRDIARVLSVENQMLRASGNMRFSWGEGGFGQRGARDFSIGWTENESGNLAAGGSYFFSPGPVSAVIYFTPSPTDAGKINRGKYRVRADVEYTVQRDPWQTNPDAVKPMKVKGDYIYSEQAAERLANIIERRTRHSQYLYAARSSEVYAVGDYVTLQISWLNLDTTARVVKRTFAIADQPVGADIYRYELEGVAALGVLVGQLTGGTLVEIGTAAQQHHAAAAASAGLDGSGNVTLPVRGNFLQDTPPDETGLYMTRNFLGFFNVTDDEADPPEGEWVARIENDDGTGKFRVGDDTHHVDWDGSALTVKGAASIDGQITAGDGIQSDNYVAGSTGWAISGDGSAEFRDVLVRGDLLSTSESLVQGTVYEGGLFVRKDPNVAPFVGEILVHLRDDRVGVYVVEELGEPNEIIHAQLGMLQQFGGEIATVGHYVPWFYGSGLVDPNVDVDEIDFGVVRPEDLLTFTFDGDYEDQEGDDEWTKSNVKFDTPGRFGDQALAADTVVGYVEHNTMNAFFTFEWSAGAWVRTLEWPAETNAEFTLSDITGAGTIKVFGCPFDGPDIEDLPGDDLEETIAFDDKSDLISKVNALDGWSAADTGADEVTITAAYEGRRPTPTSDDLTVGVTNQGSPERAVISAQMNPPIIYVQARLFENSVRILIVNQNQYLVGELPRPSAGYSLIHISEPVAEQIILKVNSADTAVDISSINSGRVGSTKVRFILTKSIETRISEAWLLEDTIDVQTIEDYRALVQPWGETDFRDTRIQARPGRNIKIVTTDDGLIELDGLPTSDPESPGALWVDTNGFLKVSMEAST